jgi:predicted GNAT superfamily acetyltransferase
MTLPGADIEIRHCDTLAEYEDCVRIEHLTWGEEIAVPSAMFVVAHHTGGQVIGAFHGHKMMGFTLALVGIRRSGASGGWAARGGQFFLHSHMTAVLPEFRDRGVGRRLKLFQRQDALKRGIDLVEWTFDPLEIKNAHFNLVRLGAVARRLIPNCYGVTKSPLHAGLPTDRLVAEWWLGSERVRSTLADNPLPLRRPADRISLPANLGEIKEGDREAGARIQADARAQFEKWFAAGYVATTVETNGTTTDYILEPGGSVAGLRLPQIDED